MCALTLMMNLIYTGFFKYPYPNPEPIIPELCAVKLDQNHQGAIDLEHQPLILNFFVIPKT